MTNTINNVPRELLERVIMSTYMYWPDAPLIKEIRALLSAPSPAGVDGLEVVGYSYGNGILINDTTQPDNPMYTKLVRLSAAQAIIDGLRARCFSLVMNCAAELETASYCMTDEEAKRIAQSGADYYRKEARLSAGKEGSDG